MDHYNIFLLLILVLVEAVAMSTIEYGANKHSNVYIIGILLYLLVGYILYKILIARLTKLIKISEIQIL